MVRLADMLAATLVITTRRASNTPNSYEEGAVVMDLDAIRTGQSESVVSDCCFDKGCQVRLSGSSKMYSCHVYDNARVTLEDGAVLSGVQLYGDVHVKGAVIDESSLDNGRIDFSRCNHATLCNFSVGKGCALVYSRAEGVSMGDDVVVCGVRLFGRSAELGPGCILAGLEDYSWDRRPRITDNTAANSYTELRYDTLTMGPGARLLLDRSTTLRTNYITIGPATVIACKDSARFNALSAGKGSMALINNVPGRRPADEPGMTRPPACPVGPFGKNLRIRLGQQAFLSIQLGSADVSSPYPINIEVADNEAAVLT